MAYQHERKTSSAAGPGVGAGAGATVLGPGKRTLTEGLSGGVSAPPSSIETTHGEPAGRQHQPPGAAPRTDPFALQAQHELQAEQAELAADESEVAAILAFVVRDGDTDDPDDDDDGGELERETGQIEDESDALDNDARALAQHPAAREGDAGAARQGAHEGDAGAARQGARDGDAPQETASASAAPPGRAAQAARRSRVPDTDAEIRRIRAGWKRLRDRARRARHRARAERDDKTNQRDRRRRRRDRDSNRKDGAHARKRKLERIKDRREAKLEKARRKERGGGLIGALLDLARQILARAIELLKQIVDAIRKVIALINRLIRLIARANDFLRAVARVIKRIVSVIGKAIEQVARWVGKLADPDMQPFGFDRTGEPRRETRTERTEGLIFVEEGRNLHEQPDSDSPVVRLLGYGTRVYVHDRDVAGGWAKVTTARGQEGYVSNSVVKTDLPCPGARLHIVESGQTALRIAGRYFGGDQEPGHDGRFFVNVLQFVNQDSAIGDQHDWRNVKFKANHSIWIPTPEFAQTLRGKVDDGSITNGLWAKTRDAVETAVDVAVGAVAFAAGLIQGIVFEVKDIIGGVIDLVGEVVELIKSVFTGEILGNLEDTWNELKSIDIRALLQGFLDKWNDENPWDRWRFRGEVIGRVATEVVLAVLSGGVTAVVSGTSKFARLTAAVSRLKFVRKIERTARTQGHALPSKLDALRTRRRPDRTAGDVKAQERSEGRNDARPGSGTPAAIDWRDRTAGGGAQQQLLQQHAQKAFDDGATDIRVDQAQVGAARNGEAIGDKLGSNRPDLQYTDAQGRRHYVEYDSYQSDRGRQHLRRILANDPEGQIELWQQIRVRHGSKFEYEYVKVFP
jgi:Bacterial SH3 domain